MNALAYTLIALACYRLATDVAWEAGPFGWYERLRSAVIARFGADSWQAEGIGCPICLSMWTALLFYGLWFVFPPVVIWFAVAGAAALLARLPK